jgi:hypothetical protein
MGKGTDKWLSLPSSKTCTYWLESAMKLGTSIGRHRLNSCAGDKTPAGLQVGRYIAARGPTEYVWCRTAELS